MVNTYTLFFSLLQGFLVNMDSGCSNAFSFYKFIYLLIYLLTQMSCSAVLLWLIFSGFFYHYYLISHLRECHRYVEGTNFWKSRYVFGNQDGHLGIIKVRLSFFFFLSSVISVSTYLPTICDKSYCVISIACLHSILSTYHGLT